jgi:hypothetical protein
MKNKSELMFLLKVIVLILVIILLILFYFLYKSININNKHNKIPKIVNKKIVKKYNIDNKELIEIDFKNYEVLYGLTNGDKLIIKQNGKANKLYVDVTKSNKKISIKETVSNILEKKSFKIYIPKKYESKVKIINGFSNIRIDGIKELSLDNNAGNVKIKNVNNLNIKNVSGNIYITGDLDTIKGNSSTGDININKLNESCDIETITGDIIIKEFIIKEQSSIETTSGNIEIKVDKKSDCKFKYSKKQEYSISNKKCIDGKNDLELKNVTGNIIIK